MMLKGCVGIWGVRIRIGQGYRPVTDVCENGI